MTEQRQGFELWPATDALSSALVTLIPGLGRGPESQTWNKGGRGELGQAARTWVEGDEIKPMA